MKFNQALQIAERLLDDFMPYCERAEIAGSIRRRKADVKDIEIVAIPKIDHLSDLFGNPRIKNNCLLGYMNTQKGRFDFCLGGERYKKIQLREGIKLDLFMVLPPAQWGVIFTIRTGPAAFSRKIVTQRKFGGYLPSDCKVKDGAVWCNGQIITMPEERDFLKFIDLPLYMYDPGLR